MENKEEKIKLKIQKIDNKEIPQTILEEKIANLKSAERIHKLQEEISKIEGKAQDGNNKFAVDSTEFIKKIISSKRGEIVFYLYNDDIVGFFELTVPDDPKDIEDEYQITKILNNTSTEKKKEIGIDYIDIDKVGVAESFVVFPKYRGNNLQFQMLKRMEQMARERGITHLIGTVSPENKYSKDNFDKAGYKTLLEKDFGYGYRELKIKQINTLKSELEKEENNQITR